MIFLIVFVFFAFGTTDKQEEIDFLLFLPNSGNSFVNADQAEIQLDNVAKYLLGKNLVPGQIAVYGYAAFAASDIEPMSLSAERALFVINALQKRGVSGELFADPVGYGSVDLWGNNTDEGSRSPNRRVRILVDDIMLTPEVVNVVEPEPQPEPEPEPEPEIITSPVIIAEAEEQSKSPFPWIILLPLLLIPLLLFWLLKNKRGTKTAAAPIPQEAPAPAPTPAPPPVVAMSESIVNLEEEIRFRAYEISLARGGQPGEMMEEDWYTALPEVCARYESKGYQTYPEAGSWWARRTVKR